MIRYLSLLVASLVSLCAFAAGDDIDVCATVPAGDVEATLGYKVAKTEKGLRECRWVAPNPTVFAIATSTAAIRDPKIPNMKEFVAAMAQQGWKPKVTDDTPTLWCMEGTASAGPVVVCRATGKGRELQLTVSGQGMSAAKAKAFLSKFIARLP